MDGWHHRLDGREFEQAPGVGDGQGGLACCSPWGRKESDTTEQQPSGEKGVFSEYLLRTRGWSGPMTQREAETVPAHWERALSGETEKLSRQTTTQY